jgi:hypothetical protein
MHDIIKIVNSIILYFFNANMIIIEIMFTYIFNFIICLANLSLMSKIHSLKIYKYFDIRYYNYHSL